MAERVVLHVGSPKSGTTYLQNRLFANADELAQHGVVTPGRRRGERYALPFLAALDLLGIDGLGPLPTEYGGRWSDLVRLTRRTRGTVVISHEVLARADIAVAAPALAELAGGATVEIVLTARDLGRSLPAAWQEALKHGGTSSFAQYLRRARRGRAGMVRSMDPVEVLSAWAAGVAADRVHVVTAPPAGSDPEELWRRFSAALGIEPTWAATVPTHDNPSPGVAGAQLLRALNAELGADTGRGTRLQPIVWGLVRERMAEQQSVPVRLGPTDEAWAIERAESWIGWLREQEYVVHGALDELRPTATDPVVWVDPDLPLPEVGSVAIAELAAEVRARATAGRMTRWLRASPRRRYSASSARGR